MVKVEDEWDGSVPERGDEGWTDGGDGVDLAAAVTRAQEILVA
jgi:hypothetical protein